MLQFAFFINLWVIQSVFYPLILNLYNFGFEPLLARSVKFILLLQKHFQASRISPSHFCQNK